MALPTASDNTFPSVRVVETASGSLATVGAGNQRLAIDPTSHLLYWKDNSAVIRTAIANPMTAANDLIIGGASGLPTRLATVASKALVTDGSGVISWGTAAGGSGALVFLEAHTASTSATLDFTSFISSTYDDYLIEGNFIRPANNAVDLNVEFGTGGGPTWDSTSGHYAWGTSMVNIGTATTVLDDSNAGLPNIFKSMANDAGYGNGSFSLRLTNPQSTSQRRKLHGTGAFANTTTPAERFGTIGVIWTDVTNAMTGVRFLMSSGNISSGIIRIYGIAKS